MASHTSKTAASKPSFASVAAMAPHTPSSRSPALRENKKPSVAPMKNRINEPYTVDNQHVDRLHQELQGPMSRLAVKTSPALSSLNDQQKNNISRAGLRFDDDQTQTSTSSTKPASLDGKSTTSGTTFALDEKESLRPDDSASVKAAEDEECGSGPASGAQNSRVSSEAGGRAFRDQFYEVNESIGTGSHRMHPLGRRVIAGIEEEGPQITVAPLVNTIPAPVNLPPPQLVGPPVPSIDYQYQEPDEKLLEALESPKDRLFLLRLEQEVITFVRESTEPMIDLPPCNSFCRLLAHKLADYYALTHFVDNAVSSVRLFRTPYCRIPTPLSTLVVAPAPGDNAPSSQPTMKIMRRAGLGKDCQANGSGADTTEGSMAPSKDGSETGYDSQPAAGVASPTDSNLAKEKSAMTMEERQAKYKETRERIFGPESETADNEVVNEVSRSSSRNDKKKKKHKTADDGFTARSQYNAYYPNMQYPVTSFEQTECPAYYSPYVPQGNGAMTHSGTMGATLVQQGFHPGFVNIAANSQGFSNNMNGGQMTNGYEIPSANGSNQQLPPPFYPHMQETFALSQQSSAISSPALDNNGQYTRPQSQMSEQHWQQSGYDYNYQQPRDHQQFAPPQMSDPSSMMNVQSVPYQYGQLPLQPGLQGAKAQHPLPGSYKSQSFNPQTRAFIPNGASGPSQVLHHGNSPNHTASRSSAVSFQNGPQFPTYVQQAPSYSQMPSIAASSSFAYGLEAKSYGARKSSAQSNGPQSPVQSSLSKWGTPAHLPPKPPPQAPSMPEGQHSLPLNNQFNVHVQPINGGQPMPSYQNGVWSLPGASTQST